MEYTPVFKLRDFSRGIMARDANPLSYPVDALLDGENVIIQNKSLRIRPGYTLLKSTAVAANPVRFIGQVRFPTNEVTYLILQCGNKLYVTTDNLPTTTATWTEIYDLGTGSGVVTMAAMNDRAILTEGFSEVPLVFLGCQETDGSDWAVPLTVLFSFDGNGYFYHNINEDVLDKDDTTYEDISSFPLNDLTPDTFIGMYFRFDTPKVSGLYFKLSGTGNQDTVGATYQYWNGSAWTNCASVTDGTSSGGKAMTQSGVVTFTEVTMDHYLVGEVPGYWMRVVFDADLSADSNNLVRVLFKAPCQPLSNIGDGQPDTPMAVVFEVNAAGSTITGQIIDITKEVADYTLPTWKKLNDGVVDSPYGMVAGDYLYFAFPTTFNRILLEPHEFHPNVAAAKFATPQYWDGDSWANVSDFSDGTLDSTTLISLSRKGTLSFSTPSVWRKMRPWLNANYPTAYWIRVGVTAALTEEAGLSEVRVMPVPIPLRKQKLVCRKVNRMILGNSPSASDEVMISRALAEYGWDGPDAYFQRIGGQDALVSMLEIYNQVFMFKTEEGYMLNGTRPGEYSFERAELSGQVPLNQRVCVIAPIAEADAKNKMGFYYLNSSGVYHFTGLQLYRISDPTGWWNPNGSDAYVDHSLLYGSVGCYYPERNWVCFSVPLITASDPTPTENNYMIVFDLNLKAWLTPFRLARATHGGITSLCTAYAYNANGAGKLGKQRLYAGTSNGYVLELFDQLAEDDAGTDISGYAETGWLDFDVPEVEKKITTIALYGQTDNDDITLYIKKNGDDTLPTNTQQKSVIEGLSGLGSSIKFGSWPWNRGPSGHFFKLRIQMDKPTTIYGVDLSVALRRIKS